MRNYLQCVHKLTPYSLFVIISIITTKSVVRITAVKTGLKIPNVIIGIETALTVWGQHTISMNG